MYVYIYIYIYMYTQLVFWILLLGPPFRGRWTDACRQICYIYIQLIWLYTIIYLSLSLSLYVYMYIYMYAYSYITYTIITMYTYTSIQLILTYDLIARVEAVQQAVAEIVDGDATMREHCNFTRSAFSQFIFLCFAWSGFRLIYLPLFIFHFTLLRFYQKPDW